ncbi:MAG: hypothetical protein HN929_10175, partial [Chloroflexi bacterium]|nr:hypothetical protein [Chloroflexota bacterium]
MFGPKANPIRERESLPPRDERESLHIPWDGPYEHLDVLYDHGWRYIVSHWTTELAYTNTLEEAETEREKLALKYGSREYDFHITRIRAPDEWKSPEEGQSLEGAYGHNGIRYENDSDNSYITPQFFSHVAGIDYNGMGVMMRPSKFRRLAERLAESDERKGSKTFLKAHIESGRPIQFPQLTISTDDKGRQYVSGHEGRHRTRIIWDMVGNVPMPVVIFSRYERARHLTKARVAKMQEGLISETDSRWMNADWAQTGPLKTKPVKSPFEGRIG